MVLRATVIIKSVALRATDSANSSLIIIPVVLLFLGRCEEYLMLSQVELNFFVRFFLGFVEDSLTYKNEVIFSPIL